MEFKVVFAAYWLQLGREQRATWSERRWQKAEQRLGVRSKAAALQTICKGQLFLIFPASAFLYFATLGVAHDNYPPSVSAKHADIEEHILIFPVLLYLSWCFHKSVRRGMEAPELLLLCSLFALAHLVAADDVSPRYAGEFVLWKYRRIYNAAIRNAEQSNHHHVNLRFGNYQQIKAPNMK